MMMTICDTLKITSMCSMHACSASDMQGVGERKGIRVSICVPRAEQILCMEELIYWRDHIVRKCLWIPLQLRSHKAPLSPKVRGALILASAWLCRFLATGFGQHRSLHMQSSYILKVKKVKAQVQLANGACMHVESS